MHCLLAKFSIFLFFTCHSVLKWLQSGYGKAFKNGVPKEKLDLFIALDNEYYNAGSFVFFSKCRSTNTHTHKYGFLK